MDTVLDLVFHYTTTTHKSCDLEMFGMKRKRTTDISTAHRLNLNLIVEVKPKLLTTRSIKFSAKGAIYSEVLSSVT